MFSFDLIDKGGFMFVLLYLFGRGAIDLVKPVNLVDLCRELE